MFSYVWMRNAAGTLLALAALAGCSPQEKLNPVTGKVLFQGEPLAGALVSFHTGGSQPYVATGLTKEDGTFSVVTGESEGAHAGKYKVTVMCHVPVKSQATGMAFGGMEETEDRLKGAYSNFKTSTIEVEIKEGPNQLEPFDLK
jgi:hypothetical protein